MASSNASGASIEEPFGEIFEQIQDMLSLIVNGHLTAICAATGVPLNIFCIFVFLRSCGTTPIIQYYLVTLTAWQTALLCNAFLLYCLPTLMYGHLVATGTYVYLYPYAYTMANMTHTGSVWIVLVLTIDRYLALCQPLKHRAIGKRSRVKRLMIFVSISAALYSLPRFFEVQVRQTCFTWPGEGEQCIPKIGRTELTSNATYWTIYHIFLAMLFVTLVPCLLLFGLTLRISFALRQAVVRRKSLCAPNVDLDSRNKKCIPTRKEHKSNIMLVLVIAKFLISDILPTVADVLEHIVGESAFTSSSMATLFVDVSNFLLVLNCSTNFWVFVFWGKRFRRSLRQMLIGTKIGFTIYKLTHFGSDPELITGQSSASTAPHTITKCVASGYGSNGNSVAFNDKQKNRSKSMKIESSITALIPPEAKLPQRSHFERSQNNFRRQSAVQWDEYERTQVLARLAQHRQTRRP